MATVWFIPHPLAVWADQNRNDTIRTAVPFAVLGGLVGIQLAWQNCSLLQWLLVWLCLVVLVVLAEAGQLFLAHRSCDIGDIGWGITGGLVGLSIVAIIKRLLLAMTTSRKKLGVRVKKG